MKLFLLKAGRGMNMCARLFDKFWVPWGPSADVVLGRISAAPPRLKQTLAWLYLKTSFSFLPADQWKNDAIVLWSWILYTPHLYIHHRISVISWCLQSYAQPPPPPPQVNSGQRSQNQINEQHVLSTLCFLLYLSYLSDFDVTLCFATTFVLND